MYVEGGYEFDGVFGYWVGGEEWFEQVGGEDECYYILRGGLDDKQFNLQFKEGGQ